MSTQREALRPKLRPLDVRRFGDILVLRDPLGLCPQEITFPSYLGPLLSLMDGSRDINGIQMSFHLLTGHYISLTSLEELVSHLEACLLLDGPLFRQTYDKALQEYRRAPFRQPALTDKVYPGEPEALSRTLAGYIRDAPPPFRLRTAVGIISPHIDYARGWKVYAATWGAIKEAVQEATLVLAFGTDHAGGHGRLTLTRQSYATPWGVLPTDTQMVEELAEVLGEEAFQEEIHHRNEHSLELALVWLHYMRQGCPVTVVPILCGSFAPFVDGPTSPMESDRIARAVEILSGYAARPGALVVAAADLAHVGPAFGDPMPWGLLERAQLHGSDDRLLESISRCDAEGFLAQVRACGDRYRICGLPPIYLALKVLGTGKGYPTGYQQCPADPQGGSLVSIAGMVLER